MKKQHYSTVFAAVTAFCLAIASGVAAADDAKWLVRTTGVYLNLDGDSSALDLDVDDTWDIAIDGTYFVTPNIAINLLATKLKIDVDSALGDLGSVDLVPPILTVQYHFAPDEAVRPYVGIGFNYNIFSEETGTLDAVSADLEDKIGYVAQVGMDYMLADAVSLNLDLKYLQVDNIDVDTDIGDDELDIEAWIIGAGIGFRF